LPSKGGLILGSAAEPGAEWSGPTLQVRWRRGGEKLRLAHNRPRREIRNLFQEAGVPPWLRERTPMIELDGELVAVGEAWRTEAFDRLLRAQGVCVRHRF